MLLSVPGGTNVVKVWEMSQIVQPSLDDKVGFVNDFGSILGSMWEPFLIFGRLFGACNFTSNFEAEK